MGFSYRKRRRILVFTTLFSIGTARCKPASGGKIPQGRGLAVDGIEAADALFELGNRIQQRLRIGV
jgi:hypothetical protein